MGFDVTYYWNLFWNFRDYLKNHFFIVKSYNFLIILDPFLNIFKLLINKFYWLGNEKEF